MFSPDLLFPAHLSQFPSRRAQNRPFSWKTAVQGLFQGFPATLPFVTGTILNNFQKKERINIRKKTLYFRILVRFEEYNGFFYVLDESYPALKIGSCAPIAMGRLDGKPRNRARTDVFRRMACFALSARKLA